MKRLLATLILAALPLVAADTARNQADVLALFADGQPADSLSPQDLRDFIVSILPGTKTEGRLLRFGASQAVGQTSALSEDVNGNVDADLIVATNAQTGTTYTVLATDHGKSVTHSNGASIAVTLPEAGAAGFETGFWYYTKNLGAGAVTITPTTSTIAGGATLVLTTGQWVVVVSDGTDYNIYGVRLTAGASITITDAVTGQTIAVTDAVSSWVKYTVTFEDAAFIVADTGGSASLFTLPAKGVITGVRIKTSTAFAGTAVTAVSCSVGDAAGDTNDPDAYMVAYDVFAATGDTNQAWDGGAYSTTAAQQDVELHCTCNVNFGNGSATVLTAGSVDVHVEWATLP